MTKKRIPPHLIALGGITFVLGLIVSPWITVVGVIDGIYMMGKYPHKKIHGAIILILNLIVLLLILCGMLVFNLSAHTG